MQILVENQGRIGYGAYMKDFKGLVSDVTLGKKVLKGWSMYSMPLDDGKLLAKYAKTVLEEQKSNAEIKKMVEEDFKARF